MTRRKTQKPKPVEPQWVPPPHQPFTPLQIAGIVLRHLIPLAGVLLFGSSAGQFLVLSVFNLAFTIAGIGVIGVGVSTRREVGPSPNLADAVTTWLLLFSIMIVISLVLTAMFGWVIMLLVADTAEGLFTPALGWAVLLMMVGAAPGLFQQYQADLRAPLTDAQRQQRDQPIVMMHVFCAGLIFILSGYIPEFGHFGFVIAAFLVTGLFLFRDLRPDLVRTLFPSSRRPQADERDRKTGH